jgi:hypothetical protein
MQITRIESSDVTGICDHHKWDRSAEFWRYASILTRALVKYVIAAGSIGSIDSVTTTLAPSGPVSVHFCFFNFMNYAIHQLVNVLK